MVLRSTGRRLEVALLAVAVLAACGGGSSSEPSPPGPQPLRFGRSVNVGGFCCLLHRPRLVASGDRVFVAWTQAVRYTTSIPLRRSSDAGLSFPDELDFVDAESGDRDAIRLAIAPGGILSLVWEDSRSGRCDPFCQGYQVFTTRSADGGARFTANRAIAPAAGDEQSNPVQLIADNGDVFMAWQQRSGGRATIQVARSLDAGASYQSAVPADPAADGDQSFPAIAMQPDGRLYAAWLDRRSGWPEVYFSRSLDRGASFGPGVPLHPSVPEVTDRAGVQLAVTGAGRLVAAWTERRDGRWQVQRSVSLDGGQSFTAPRPVDPAAVSGDQSFPALAVRATGEVYLAWQDKRSGTDRARIARSTDGADTFETSVPIDDSGAADGSQWQPDIYVDATGSVLAVWVDLSKPASGIYFARSIR